MDNAIIFLEPGQNARRNFIIFVEKLLRFFELNILKYLLKKIMRTSNVIVYSQDQNEFSYLAKIGIKIILIDNIRFSQDQIARSKKFSKYVAKNWYNQNYSDLLNFEGINLGESTEQETMEIIDELFKKFLNYESILKENLPNTVFIESLQSSDGKAIQLICEDLGIKCIPLFPKLYGKLKIWFINKIKYKTFKKIIIDPINLYVIQRDSKSQESRNQKLLMDVPYPNHLDVVYPTIERFISKGYTIYLLARFNDIQKYESDYTFLKVNMTKYKSNDLNEKLDNYFSFLENNNIFGYEKINLWNLIKDDLYLSQKNKLTYLLNHLKIFINIVELIEPRMVMVGDDRAPSSVRIDVLFCKKNSIPHFEVQHGIYTTNSLMAKPLSDKIFIWGEATKNALIDSGANNGQMKVTGSPKYDSLINKSNDYNSIINKYDKTILFATQPVPGNINHQIINKIGLYLKKKEGVRLVVKPHPSESADYYNGFVEPSEDIIKVTGSNEDMIDLLLKADVIIIISSTVGIEAAILDKPMICVNLSDERSEYVEGGVALEVKDLEDLIPQINNAMYDGKTRKNLAECRKKFVHNYAYLQDGKASERIVDAIIKTIDSKDDT